jgi:hypothetical protein
MAATHLTLEEAAERLGISPEQFKKRLKTDPAFKTLVPIRDGSTLRFKPAAIDELARQLGAASDPELPLAPLEEGLPPDSDDFKVPATGAKSGKIEKSEKGDKKGEHDPLPLVTSDDDIFSLAADEGKPEAAKKPKSDPDSDARLDPGAPKKPKSTKDGSDEAVVPTEEIAIDFSGPGSAVIKGGSSSKLSAPKSSGKISSGKLSAADSAKNLANPGGGDSSEFELSLDADSDDFELKLNTEASDEVALGALPKDTTGSGKRAGESGINLRDPADSGISLEKGKAKDKEKEKEKEDKPAAKPGATKTDSDSDVDFELTLDSSSAASGIKLGGLKGSKALDPDSDSEFELTLDDSGGSSIEHAALGAAEAEAEKGDIFETDFEIPPMESADSGSEAVALESDTDLEKSEDFDVAVGDSDVVDDTSGSEVVLLEDDADAPKAKKGKPVKRKADEDEADVDLADVEEAEEESSVSKALKGVKGRRRDEEEEEEAEAVPAGAGAYRPVPWGPVPAIFLLLAFPLMVVGGLMAYELLQTMWGYQQPRKPAAPLVRELAKAFDMELRDQ